MMEGGECRSEAIGVSPMRMLVNAIVGLCVAALVAVVWVKSDREQDEAGRALGAASAIRNIQQVLSYQAAYDKAPANSRGWPITIDPAWFEGEVPRNPLVSSQHPWIEIAPPSDAGSTISGSSSTTSRRNRRCPRRVS